MNSPTEGGATPSAGTAAGLTAAGHLAVVPAGGAEALDAELRSAAARVARVPVLLVACDYDGTLAPIVEDPTRAVPLPEAVAALRALASLPQTTVAVISGRALRDLAALSRLPSEVHLVGSHGSEFDVGFVDALGPELQQLRGELVETLSGLVRRRAGVRLEVKPASVAVHLRGAAPEVSHLVLDAIRTGPATWPGINVTEGKEVIELSVITTNKGLAVDALRAQLSASAVVYFGDDVTDENAFAELHGPDLSVKVGAGPTAARHRVSGPVDAVRLLGLLLHHRRQWLFGERAVPIERHSMLANGRTIALVTPDARVSWLCHPRPDSSALFADLLGGPTAGHFTITPERGGLPLGQRYLPGTMTVETRWSGLTITDWLDLHQATAEPPDGLVDNQGTVLMRVLSGTARAKIEFVPRPEFGQLPIRLQPLGDGLLVLGSSEPIALHSPGIDWDDRERRRQRGGPGHRRPVRRRRRRRARTAPGHRQPGDRTRSRRASGRRSPSTLARLGGVADPARPGPRIRHAQRPHPARPVPRTDRRHPRGRHLVAARGDRRRPQLGLPVLLAARRRDDRAGTGRPGLARRGRPAGHLDAAGRRQHRRPPGAAAPAVRGRRQRTGRRGGHRHPARVRRVPAGTRRQRRQPPGPARRVRAGGRPDPGRRRAPRAAPGRHRTSSRRWSRRSSGAGTNPTTACGRPGCRRATTCTRRSCAG